jgi:hypothetical protein
MYNRKAVPGCALRRYMIEMQLSSAHEKASGAGAYLPRSASQSACFGKFAAVPACAAPSAEAAAWRANTCAAASCAGPWPQH